MVTTLLQELLYNEPDGIMKKLIVFIALVLSLPVLGMQEEKEVSDSVEDSYSHRVALNHLLYKDIEYTCRPDIEIYFAMKRNGDFIEIRKQKMCFQGDSVRRWYFFERCGGRPSFNAVAKFDELRRLYQKTISK